MRDSSTRHCCGAASPLHSAARPCHGLRAAGRYGLQRIGRHGLRAAGLAGLLVVGLAGCGSGRSGTDAAPAPASAATAVATRRFLAGPGGPLLHLHAMAAATTASTPPATCRARGREMVQLVESGSPSAGAGAGAGLPPDTVLGELMADEEAALARALAACASGTASGVVLRQLVVAREAVGRRLAADGVRS